jgi:hypothetical protein
MREFAEGIDYRIEESGCWIWLGAQSNGYGQVSIDGRLYQAHQVSWENVNGPAPPKREFHHNCETPLCIRPDHVEPLSRSAHQRRHHRRAVPELIEEAIRKDHVAGMGYRRLMRKYNLKRTHIQKICKR